MTHQLERDDGDVVVPHTVKHPGRRDVPAAYIRTADRARDGRVRAVVDCPFCGHLHRHLRLTVADAGYRTPPCQAHTGRQYRITGSSRA